MISDGARYLAAIAPASAVLRSVNRPSPRRMAINSPVLCENNNIAPLLLGRPEMGLRNSLGNPIKANQVDFILNNPFYYGEMYQQKLQEYKKRQREITREMEAHVDADETCFLTIKTVVDLARRAKEIYLSSNLDEKRELLNLVFSNLKLREKRLLMTLREPFSLLMAASHQPMCLRM